MDDHGAGGDDGLVSYGHAFANDRIRSDEDTVPDLDGGRTHGIWHLTAGTPDRRVCGMEVGIEQLRSAADEDIIAYRHGILAYDRGVRHPNPVSNFERTVLAHPYARTDGADLRVAAPRADVKVVANFGRSSNGDVYRWNPDRAQSTAETHSV